MKRKLAVALAAVFAAVLCLGCLAACGSGGQQASYTGRSARDSAEFDEFVSSASTLGESREAAKEQDAEDVELNAAAAETFAAANAAYRNKDYAAAEASYVEVLEGYSKHYGANTNLTLAMLQQGKNDEALTQSLVCLYLFADGGNLLNAQVASVASGFSLSDPEFMGKLRDFIATSPRSRDYYMLFNDMDYRKYMSYNDAWDAIETELYGAAQAQPLSDADKQTYQEKYYELLEMMFAVDEQMPTDQDTQMLLSYYKEVARQLGLEGEMVSTSEQGSAGDSASS